MLNFSSFLPNGYNPNQIKKIPKEVVTSTAVSLGLSPDTPANAVAKAATGARWKCISCGGQTKLISFNQGFREYCSTKCLNTSPDIVAKKQQTSLAKYGTLYPNQSQETKSKIRSKLIGRISETKDDVIGLIEKQGFKVLSPGETFSDSWNLKCECSHEFSLVPPTWQRWSSGWKTICPVCSKGSSSQEKDLARIIENFGFEIIRRDRTLIAPLELDIFIPSKNLAVEFNGLYWHSDDKKRHLDKLNACNKVGIKLIQIFEHDWNNRKDVVMSRLKSALGLNTKIYARNAEVVSVSSKEAREFFDKNHLQGNARGGKYFYALKYEGQIVQMISLCKSRFSKLAPIELLRSASADGITVVGGLSKLIKFARKEIGVPIITYADRCWGEGLSYVKAGATQMAATPPSYIWWKGEKTASRFYAQKRTIGKILEGQFDPNKSEQDNMRSAGWRQLWNAGNNVFVFN